MDQKPTIACIHKFSTNKTSAEDDPSESQTGMNEIGIYRLRVLFHDQEMLLIVKFQFISCSFYSFLFLLIKVFASKYSNSYNILFE